jgi:hypothetical protein
MTFGRYLTVLGTSCLGVALAMASFNLIVDALGMSPVRIAIAGFNEWKPFRNDYDWIVKRYDVTRNQPRTIFVGSSRIKQTIDPKLVTAAAFVPVYNGGINGSADFVEIGAYVREYLGTDKNLSHVFIEAFVPALLTRREGAAQARPAPEGPVQAPPLPEQAAQAPPPHEKASEPPRPFVPTAAARPESIEFGFAADLVNFTSVFFSTAGIDLAIRTVLMNLRRKNSPVLRSSDDGFAPIALQPSHFSVRNVFNFVMHTGLIRGGSAVSSEMVPAAREMIASCKSRGVECRFFISPLHADVLFAAYHLGLWPELEALKRALAELAPTYDFTRYSHIIDERIGPVIYWPEAFHFSPALGELMAKVMTGQREDDMPANFGVILDRENVDVNLLAWREERDRWIAQHPEAIQRMRMAEADFQNGMSFMQVTDREIAAGGW